ncbi:MAG: InlB B-repeat-containing protein, partial [Clostridia bacterium]|nr:InlB B-repeat-containing protein [Clostridia bacterium]
MKKKFLSAVSLVIALVMVSGIVPWSKLSISLPAGASDYSSVASLEKIERNEEDIAEESEPLIYTITLDPNGGIVDETTISVEAFAPVGELPTPVRDGYVFLGWYTEREGGEKVNSDYSTLIDRTLYAHWNSELSQSLLNNFRQIVSLFMLPATLLVSLFMLPATLLATVPPVGALFLLPLILPIYWLSELIGV